jgi:hypothetical protein
MDMIRRWLMMGLAALLLSLAGCGGGCGGDTGKNIYSARDRPQMDTAPEPRP